MNQKFVKHIQIENFRCFDFIKDENPERVNEMAKIMLATALF